MRLSWLCVCVGGGAKCDCGMREPFGHMATGSQCQSEAHRDTSIGIHMHYSPLLTSHHLLISSSPTQLPLTQTGLSCCSTVFCACTGPYVCASPHLGLAVDVPSRALCWCSVLPSTVDPDKSHWGTLLYLYTLCFW